VQFAHELRRNYPPKMDAASGMPNVVRTGKSELYPEIPEEMLVRAAQDEEHLRIIRQIGFKSALIVPLEARGQLLGGMTLVWSESERRYSESDLRFMEELARRAAIVVDNARLYRRAQDAREELTVLNETLEQRVVERTDELTAANMTLRDEIEERKRAQQTLARANALLEYRNRELQDFAYVASHDLQEPLRKILSFSSLLLDEFTDSLGEGRSYLERIDDAANRMMGLIRDLLAFSRVATQGDPFRKIDLNTVVDVALTDLEVRIAETAGRVDVAQLCVVEADELQMRQLFQNLIGNALKFHREGVPPVISVDCRLNGDYCVIEVRDNGIGFDEKYVDRIFAPFQRLHGRGSYAGTGIGLAICRRIVERHDGSISARSRPDEGSTFVVTLPLRHRTESEMDSEASAA
ncbi:MAG: ATP-binding protein, partial [Rhodothermales bacterium]